MKALTRIQLAKALRNGMILLVSLFLFTGCIFVQLREETKIIEYSTILVGNVSSSFSSGDLPIVVAAYTREKNEREIVHYTTLHQLGPYELIVPKGNYAIVAFADKNRNLCFDMDEAAGQYVGAESVIAPAGGVVLDLDDPLFSEAFGQKGYWSPLEFFKEVGGNIYFTEFISISTPWGGDALAEKGVKYSPAVIPAWKDIQAEAAKIYGFNEDHDSILSSEPVMAQYNALLNALYEKSANSSQTPLFFVSTGFRLENTS